MKLFVHSLSKKMLCVTKTGGWWNACRVAEILPWVQIVRHSGVRGSKQLASKLVECRQNLYRQNHIVSRNCFAWFDQVFWLHALLLDLNWRAWFFLMILLLSHVISALFTWNIGQICYPIHMAINSYCQCLMCLVSGSTDSRIKIILTVTILLNY